jgi:hypothetical protein
MSGAFQSSREQLFNHVYKGPDIEQAIGLWMGGTFGQYPPNIPEIQMREEFIAFYSGCVRLAWNKMRGVTTPLPQAERVVEVVPDSDSDSDVVPIDTPFG